MDEQERKLRVYLETSFVNYLTGRTTSNVKIASDQAYTRQWWETERVRCDIFVSGYTIAESEDGGSEYVRPDMSDNALIDEVREARHRIAAECGNDLRKIAQRAAEAARRFKASQAA